MPVPVPGAPVLFLDVGANAEVRPEHLVQFAFMGAAFAARRDRRSTQPRVGLLSNGDGALAAAPPTSLAAHEKLAADAGAALRRQRRGDRTGLRGAADVVVTDGFTGNVALKTMEGTSRR